MSAPAPTFPPPTFKLTAQVAVLSFLIVCASAWVRPLMLPDEGRYAGVAWEMLRSGDWLTPTLNGMAYFHKPPLFYWITATSLASFGLNEWAARLAPALGFTLAVTSSFWLIARWATDATYRLAIPALIAQPLLLVAGQYANLDMLVAGWITLTVTAFAHAAMSIEAGIPARNALRLGWVGAALGVLAKGLIGVVIPAGVIGLWLLVAFRWRTLIRLLTGCVEGPLIFLAIAAPWFVAMERIHPGFLDYFFVTQHFRRFTVGGFNNPQPIWFYPLLLTALMAPWLYWIVQGAGATKSLTGPLRDLQRLAWVWAAVVLVFFSLPKSKLVGYILPAVPPFVILATLGLIARQGPSPRARKLWGAAAGFGVVSSLATVMFVAWYPAPSTQGIARALLETRRNDGPVVMLGRYDFDTPLYARLVQPMWVVERWDDPEHVRSRDNWRKELADAARFTPALAGQVLITPDALPARLCAAPMSWLVAGAGPETWPILAVADQVAQWRTSILWRFDPALPATAEWCARHGR
jgi:4-amino-4-deoxy-L-arabinose transferase-like glycosyltransferase